MHISIRKALFGSVTLLCASSTVQAYSLTQSVYTRAYSQYDSGDKVSASAGDTSTGQWASASAVANIGLLSLNLEVNDSKTYWYRTDLVNAEGMAEFRDTISFSAEAGFTSTETLYARVNMFYDLHRDFTDYYTGELNNSFGDSAPLYNYLASLRASSGSNSDEDFIREIDLSIDPHITGQLTDIIVPDGVVYSTTSGVLATPIPGAVWLLGSGLLGLLGFARRKSA